MNDSEIVIVAARRTPVGAFQGKLSTLSGADLGAEAIRAAMADSGIPGDDVSEVIMGCVLPAGQGQAPARQAALGAGLPLSAGATTINKVCGSGMKATMQACDALKAGSADVVVAGGMESMTNAPYLLPKARGGMRMGHGEIIDHMFFDGLQNPADGHAMGVFGEACAQEYGFTRDDQDTFARSSAEKAVAAMDEGRFKDEITPITIRTRKGETVVVEDEEPRGINIEKIPSLRAAFAKDGTVTAASSSKISDGAAALVLTRSTDASKRGLQPLATVVGYATHSQEPERFTTAPGPAMKKLMELIGWTDDDVDLYEINEAFAVVAMAAIKDLGLSESKVNVNGGACAIGHPIGCTGARLIVTLVHALRNRGLKRGIASLCIGGGEATAIAVEVA